jgi:hypothetical protein
VDPVPELLVKVKSKGILVTGRGGPEVCEMLRFPHYLDSRLKHGGKFASLTRRPPFTPGKFLVIISVRG